MIDIRRAIVDTAVSRLADGRSAKSPVLEDTRDGPHAGKAASVVIGHLLMLYRGDSTGGAHAVPVGTREADTLGLWSNDLKRSEAYPYLHSSRAESVYEIIKDRIIAGIWLPGDRINDSELALELGVSKLVVREALSKLCESLILEKIHWKGYFLRKIGFGEIKSIVDVRLSLENIAVAQITQSGTEGVFNRLDAAIRTARTKIDGNDHAEYMKADFEFHNIMHESCENPWIKRIIGNLIVLINILRNLSMPDFREAALKSVEDHERILQHMREGDVQGALSALQDHMLTHIRNIQREYVRRYPEESTAIDASHLA